MTIIKGFLNRKYDFKSTNLLGGFFLWVLTSYIFYAFFQLYREVFRLFTGQHGDRTLLVLTPNENYIYNLFYASIASALGFSIALRFVFQLSVNKHDWRTKSLMRRTLNMEGFYTWSFLLWFGKLGSMLGIWYLVFAMQYDLDILKEFPLMLVLLPFVLFYSTWPNFSRQIRSKKALWFLRLTGLFLVMSFVFAFKNFTDYKKINSNNLKHSINHTFNLKVPDSQSQERIFPRSIVVDIYIVRDTLDTDVPVIFFEHVDNRVDLKNIPKAVANEMEKVSVYEQSKLTANLHIDEHISMEHVNPIINELRKANLRKVQFSTGRKYSRYPSEYPAFKYSGIQKVLPLYYSEFEKYLDSAERIDLSGKAFRLSESTMYRNGALKEYNRIEITATPKSITLNGQKINSLDLEQKIYGFIKKYSPNYVIIFNSSKDVTYGRYIEILDLLWTQVDRLRNEFSLDLYNQPFENWYWGAELDSIKRQYPRNILEWSTEEQRLNELIRKAGNIR